MVIGVPKEIKDHETRVGCVPSMVTALRERGHEVLVEIGAGIGSSIPDEEYAEAGAILVPDAGGVWNRSELIVKVKEPQPSEYAFFRPGLILPGRFLLPLGLFLPRFFFLLFVVLRVNDRRAR